MTQHTATAVENIGALKTFTLKAGTIVKVGPVPVRLAEDARIETHAENWEAILRAPIMTDATVETVSDGNTTTDGNTK